MTTETPQSCCRAARLHSRNAPPLQDDEAEEVAGLSSKSTEGRADAASTSSLPAGYMFLTARQGAAALAATTAAAAALPFSKASAAASTPTSNSASFLPFASDCFALFALLSFAEANQPGANRPEHSASFAASRSRTASFTIGQTGLYRLETDFLRAATNVLLPSAMV